MKHRLLGPTYRISQSVTGRECAFLTSSQVILMLMAWGHFKGHWLGSSSPDFSISQ